MPLIFHLASILAAPYAQVLGSLPDFRIAELTKYSGKKILPDILEIKEFYKYDGFYRFVLLSYL
jgi:hypothetical protein